MNNNKEGERSFLRNTQLQLESLPTEERGCYIALCEWMKKARQFDVIPRLARVFAFPKVQPLTAVAPQMCGDARQEDFIPVLGVPTYVLKYGQIFEKTSSKTLILMIPGLPGIAYYYEDFVQRLHQLTGLPAWVVSYAGHVTPPDEDITELKEGVLAELNTVEGQTRHKMAFIEENIPKDVKLILIGHSCGGYIALKLLDQLKHSTHKCLMLFPTLDRLADSPGGRPILGTSILIRCILQTFANLFSYVPYHIRLRLVKLFLGGENKYPNCVFGATTDFLTPFIMKHFLMTSVSALQSIRELERTGLIEKNHEKLRLYVSTYDKYFPQEHYDRLKHYYPNLEAIKCHVDHSFHFEDGEYIADLLAKWFHAHGLSVLENGSIVS